MNRHQTYYHSMKSGFSITGHSGFLLLAAGILAICTPAGAQSGPPNILLIITDQHTGSIMTQRGYEYVTTPGIDMIAAEGVTFTRAYTPYPVCQAMRKSLLTGLMPSKVNDATAFTSLGTRMKDAGYETVYHGKWHVGETSITGDAAWHGFDIYNGGSRDTGTRDRLLAYLRQEHSKPFFLVASFMNPHDCCELARIISGIDDTYKDEPPPPLPADLGLLPPLPENFEIPPDEPDGFSVRRPEDETHPKWTTHPTLYWTELEWRQYIWGYNRLLEMVDAHIRLVMDELEARGLLENTVVIYTSDHGDGHASHMWNQKMTFYEEAINIPYIISWKGKTKAGLVDETTLISNTLDINSTVLKLAGAPVPNDFPGMDLMPAVLRDPGGVTFTPREYVISELTQADYTDIVPGDNFYGRMVVGADFKYFLFDRGENPEQLFDLANDPGEMSPVTYDGLYRDKLIEYRSVLRDWVAETNDTQFDISTMPDTLPDPVAVGSSVPNGSISFSIAGQGLIFTGDVLVRKVAIIDMLGKTIAELPVEGARVHWDGWNRKQQRALPGVYMVMPFNRKVILIH